MSDTPYTDHHVIKTYGGDIVDASDVRALERAARKVAERLREIIEHIEECDEGDLLNCDRDPHPPSVFSVQADFARNELRAFDALPKA